MAGGTGGTGRDAWPFGGTRGAVARGRARSRARARRAGPLLSPTTKPGESPPRKPGVRPPHTRRLLARKAPGYARRVSVQEIAPGAAKRRLRTAPKTRLTAAGRPVPVDELPAAPGGLKLTATRKRQLLGLIAGGHTVREAADLCEVSLGAVAYQRRTDVEFAEAFATALEALGYELEHHAIERAVHGWEVPVWYQGKQVGTKVEFDFRLSERLMEGHLPARYKRDSGTKVEVTTIVAPLTTSDLRDLRDKARDHPEVIEIAATSLAAKERAR